MTNESTAFHRAEQRRQFAMSGNPARMIGVRASINRHTNEPHEHKREIARRLARA